LTSRFTPEIRGGLIERAAAGVSLRDACRALDVRASTVKGWITRGRREAEGAYADFVGALEEARQEARDRPGPMTRDELRCEVARSARAGSVQAMKLAWEMLRADEIQRNNEAARGPSAGFVDLDGEEGD